jgi:O-antigen chain-terminating methyltransferase
VAKPPIRDTDIQRLTEERQAADRLYNDALTDLDGALPSHGRLFPPPAPPDAGQLARLNDLWSVIPPNPVPFSGWRARLGGFVWRILAPIAQRQQEFNWTVLDHLNRQSAHGGQVAALIQALGPELDALTRFEARLVQFLQQITLYVDTKDRLEAGLLQQQDERHEERLLALAAGLHGLSDELLRRWESANAREQRFATQVASIAAAQNETHLSLATFQRTSIALKRELERLASVRAVATAGNGDPHGPTAVARPAETKPEALGTRLDSGKYVGFEDSFRGSPDDIRARLLDYLPLFDGAANVVDIGCGRGEFLELLAEQGIKARGVDINHAMVDRCRSRGLDVEEGDAIQYLAAQPDASIGGLLATQVVEHLQADQLVGLLEVAYHKLQPGARIILETINPACWYAFFASYIRDITHVHPIHADTLRYLMIASGFQRVEIRYREPYPEINKLQPVSLPALARVAPDLAGLAETFNENVMKINSLLFTYLDYAAVGDKL